MGSILLIGGLPTSGKTTLAKKLSKRYNIPNISGDSLRNDFQKENPRYRDHSTRTPEEYYREFNTGEKSSREHFRWLSEYYDDFETYIRTLTEKYLYDTNDISCIMEGDSLTPELFSRLQDLGNVVCITLINTDIEHIRKTVYTRGVWDKAENYPEYIKEYEIEWLKYSIGLWREESEKYTIPVFDTSHIDFYENILEYMEVTKK